MNIISVCPSPGELTAFLTGQLSEPRLAEIGEHLARCSACMENVERCEGEDTARGNDTIRSTERGRPAVAPIWNEPACARMIAAAKELGVDLGEQASGSASSASALARERRPLPTLLGQYELLERIGDGGMGAVYKARHKRLRRIVSLKVIAEHRMADREAVDRFVREWVTLARLDHENIVRAIDADEDAGFHFLIMEFVEGIDLARLVRRGGGLRVADACEIVRQAALGLQFVCDQKLVHRDIKPSNLMVETTGKVKVLDLGLAVWKNDDSTDSGLTVAHQILGTVDYIAPEQAFDSHAVDIRADIYSLGCTLYFLLCGQSPYCGAQFPSSLKKLLAHSQAVPPSAAARRSDVPLSLDNLVRRMMAKSPVDRPASPEKVARELERFATGSDLLRLARGDATANLEGSCDSLTPPAGANTKQVPRRLFTIPQAIFLRVPRGSLRTRIGIGAILMAAVIACGGLALKGVLPHGSASSSGSDFAGLGPSNTDAKSDGEWHSVMFKRPTPLLFQPSNGASWWSYDQDSGQVRIDSVGQTLLQFGEVTADNYEVVMKVHQAPWSGGIGLFFGCHPTKFSDWRFQTLHLVAMDVAAPGGMRSFQIKRDIDFIARQGKLQQASMTETPIPDSILGMASGSTLFQSHSLRIVVRNSRLAEVWFDAESFPNLIIEPAWPGQPPQQEDLAISTADGAGGFGLFCNRGSGTVMEARYRILKGATGHGS